MRVDCNNVLNYSKERKRMCMSYKTCADGCKLYEHKKADCNAVNRIDEKAVEIVQKWSDEHQTESLADKFYKIHPNAPKNTQGIPMCCPYQLGLTIETICPRYLGKKLACKDCWERPSK